MFDGLQSKLQGVFRDLRGEGKITQKTLDSALRQIRLALLEADVHFRVVKPFIARIRERAVGQGVLSSLTPAQQVVKIVRDELQALLGEEGQELEFKGRPPAVVLLCGLQGSGKTTTAGKLAKRLKGQGRHPLLVAGDLQRAAAIEQLVQVGGQVEVPVLTPDDGEDALGLAGRAVQEARRRGRDVVILDTAGRLHPPPRSARAAKQGWGVEVGTHLRRAVGHRHEHLVAAIGAADDHRREHGHRQTAEAGAGVVGPALLERVVGDDRGSRVVHRPADEVAATRSRAAERRWTSRPMPMAMKYSTSIGPARAASEIGSPDGVMTAASTKAAKMA